LSSPLFKKYVTESASARIPATKDILKTKLSVAEALFSDLPVDGLFVNNFHQAQDAIKRTGRFNRVDMPVLNTPDVKIIQKALESGRIDVVKPFASKTGSNPFPLGLSGAKAKAWFENGLKDGDKKDDIVKVKHEKISVIKIRPLQKQIFLGRSRRAIKRSGDTISGLQKEIDTKFAVVSSDNFLLDGHHRWLAGMLLAPDSIKLNVAKIDMPAKKLLALALAASDALGNERNA